MSLLVEVMVVAIVEETMEVLILEEEDMEMRG